MWSPVLQGRAHAVCLWLPLHRYLYSFTQFRVKALDFRVNPRYRAGGNMTERGVERESHERRLTIGQAVADWLLVIAAIVNWVVENVLL